MMNTNLLNDHVGQLIREQRTALGYTQRALGEALGISSQQVQKYESGKDALNLERLYQISNALSVSPEIFFSSFTLKVSNDDVKRSGDFEASNRECLELMRNFKCLKNKALRQSILDILRSINRL